LTNICGNNPRKIPKIGPKYKIASKKTLKLVFFISVTIPQEKSKLLILPLTTKRLALTSICDSFLNSRFVLYSNLLFF